MALGDVVPVAPPPAAPAPAVVQGAGAFVPPPQLPASAQGTGGQLSVAPQDLLAMARQPPARPQPARYQPTSRSVQTTQMDPGAQQALQDLLAANTQVAAAQMPAQGIIRPTSTVEGVQVEATPDQAQKDLAKRLAAYDQATAAQAKLRRGQQESSLQADQDHIRNLLAKTEDYKENPNQWWDSKNTAQRVATGIGLALKGFAVGLTGRGQDPLDWINGQIQNSVNAQRAEHEANKSALGGAMNVYSLNKQQFDDDERSTLATEMATRNSVIADMTARANDMAAPAMARLRAAQIVQGLAQKNYEVYSQWADKTATKVSESDKYVPATTGAQDQLALLERAAKMSQAIATINTSAMAPDEKRATIAKLTAEAQTESAKAAGIGGGQMTGRVARRMSELDGLESAASDLSTLLKRGSSWSPADKEKAARLAGVLKADPKYKDLAPDPLQIFSLTGARKAGVDTIVKTIQDEKKSLQRYGAQTGGASGDIPEGLEEGAMPP